MINQNNHYDVAVVGLGALGSAAAWNAAKKGVRVIGFEQFELGHVRGASHDTSRIVRTSYEPPPYVALAKSAYNDWAQLESEAKIKLLTITGGVVFLPKDGYDGVPTASEWAKGLESNNIPCEILSASESNKRWPMFNIKDDMETLYTADSGIAHAAKSVAAMQYMARFHGADIRELTKVTKVTPTSNTVVTLETSQGEFTASKVILACDAWANELLAPLNAAIPLTYTQEQVTYFKPSDPSNYTPDKMPVWILAGPQWYYGFPTYGEPNIKCGHDNARQYITHPEQRSFVPNPDVIAQLSDTMQGLMPDPSRQINRSVTCIYTLTPERAFIIDTVPGHDDIIVTMGGGHAFKFSPAIGRVAAELAVDGKSKEDLSLFGWPTEEVLSGNRSGGKRPFGYE